MKPYGEGWAQTEGWKEGWGRQFAPPWGCGFMATNEGFWLDTFCSWQQEKEPMKFRDPERVAGHSLEFPFSMLCCYYHYIIKKGIPGSSSHNLVAVSARVHIHTSCYAWVKKKKCLSSCHAKPSEIFMRNVCRVACQNKLSMNSPAGQRPLSNWGPWWLVTQLSI